MSQRMAAPKIGKFTFVKYFFIFDAMTKLNGLKVRRNVYFIIGSVLAILNLLVDLTDSRFILGEITKNDSFNIGYLIGSHFLLFVGIVFLRFGYKAHKRIKNLDSFELNNSIEEIGKPIN